MKRQKSITKVVEAVRNLSDADMIAICTLLRRMYKNRSGEVRILYNTYIYEANPTLVFEDEMNILENVL